jgi:phage replication-related protein YjqB (UPF0714/DUF867 family)
MSMTRDHQIFIGGNDADVATAIAESIGYPGWSDVVRTPCADR